MRCYPSGSRSVMLAMGWFAVGLSTGWSIRGDREDARGVTASPVEAG